MVATAAPETPVIDRSACPATRGHGTRHYRYAHGCTCPDGLADVSTYLAAYRRGEITSSLVDAIGARRRLQALAAIGYSSPWLGRYIGCVRQHLDRIRDGQISQVQPHVHDMIAEAYRRLQDQPARGRGAGHARLAAARNQWAGPDQWGDIDDPHELDSALVDERNDGVYRREPQHLVATVDLVELAEHHRIDGRPDHDAIGRRVGMSADAVQKRLERRSQVPTRLTADQVYAIRDEYLRTRGDGWNGKATAKRYGVSTFVVSTIIHGTTRPELGLTDLTVQQGGHTPAATPTGRENRKGTAA